ncbi:hypothetical protein ASC95_11140 [Pelomonas sp. Root1217]|nr:hypothetical protein ASC95_11140 [Pelomonas sp. Root1217]
MYGMCSAKVSELVLRSSIGSHHKQTLRRCHALGRRDFCLYPLDLRHDLLALMKHLTEDWPRRFAHLMQEAGVTANRFSSTELSRPFWVDSVLSEHLAALRYGPSAAEVHAAVASILKREGRLPSKVQLKRTLGVTETEAIDDAVPTSARRLSRAELMGVLVRLAQVVQGKAAGREEQASWARDACAIGLAAWLGISFRKVVHTTLRQGRELEGELRRQAMCPGELQPLVRLLHGWLADYLASVRPRFAGYGSTATELLLTRFGEPYGGFGLAARFAGLLRDHGLQCWPRGVSLLVGAPLREDLQVDLHHLAVGHGVRQIKGAERPHVEIARRRPRKPAHCIDELPVPE